MPRDDLIDRYRGVIRAERQDVASQLALQASRNPADIARARRLARLTGVAPAVAEAQPESVQAQARQQSAGSLLDYAPELAPWLSDPDNAALARNDVPRLAEVSNLLRPWTAQERDRYLESIGAGSARFHQPAPRTVATDLRRPSARALDDLAQEGADEPRPVTWSLRRGVRGAASLFGEAGLGVVRGVAGLHRMTAEIGGDPFAAFADTETENLLRAASEAIHPDLPWRWQENVYSGLTSAVQTLAFAPAGGTMTILGLSGITSGQAYSRYRGRGGGVGEATGGALAEGVIEGLTERLSLGFLFSRFGKIGAGRLLAGFFGRELAGEEAATFLQDAVNTAVANPSATWADFWADRPQAFIDTAVATLSSVATIGGAGAIATRLQPQARAADEIAQGVAGQQLLDNLMTEASQSEVRKLDPTSFAEFVDSRADGSPVQNVYIPVEAVRAYLQSEGAETDFFEPYAEQLDEAERLNGDLVVPIGEALSGLAGSRVWDALREDVRVSPGGMSGREARERGRVFMQELEDRGAEIAKEAAEESASPAADVFQQVRQELLAAGRGEREATAIAQIVAARREAAGTRLGQSAMEYHVANPIVFRRAAKGERPAAAGKAGSSADITAPFDDEFKRLGVDDILRRRIRDNAPEGFNVAGFLARWEEADGAESGAEYDQTPEAGDALTKAYLERLAQRRQGRIFMQGKSRGQTEFYDSSPGAIVTLFADANFSTLIHELGHVFLEEMFRDAQSATAPDGLKADVGRIRAWFKTNKVGVTRGVIPVAAHEMFARGFERYAMEGKAPSVDLRGAFAQFRDWLLRIYKSVRALRAPITTEIREVFDRMLATQEALDAQEEEGRWPDQAKAQMTDAEWAAYTGSIQTARTAAYDELLGKMMAAIRRREQQKMRDQRANVRDDVAKEINARPEFVALHLLRTGRWLGEPDRAPTAIKLSTGWLTSTYGEDILNQLPRGLPIASAAGTEGDVVAEMVGMPSGDALIQSLRSIREGTDKLRAEGEKRSVRDLLIDQEADRIMAARHGDTMTDGSIEEEAIAAINSARQGEILAGQLRQLTKRKAALGNPTPYRIAREWARRKVLASRVIDVASRAAVQRYMRAAAKAGRAFEEAVLKDDIDEAFRQKQAQLLNHALLAESKSAADQVDEIVARMRRHAKRKAMGSVDQDYFDRVHELLERFDFRPRSQKAIEEQDSFEAWAARRQTEGFEVLVPPRLTDQGEHYSRIDVDTLLELDDAVASLIALGKTKQKLRDAQGERDFNEWRDTAVANILSLPPRKLGDNPSNEKTRAFVELGVGGLKIEEIADEIDRDDPNGPFNNLLVKGATKAENLRDALRQEILEPVTATYFALTPEMQDWLSEKVTSDHLTWNTVNEGDPRQGRPATLTRMEWVAVALNTGNLSNLEKMSKGERWPAPMVQSELVRILDRKEAWNFIQSLLDQVGNLWPHIAESQREMTGVVPEKVEALEIETPFGIYKGGYWPAVADVGRSQRAANSETDAANDMFGYKAGIGTPKGHTITRTGATYPMSYRLEEILFTHVERVLTRVAYAPWARDVLRVIDNGTIAGAIKTRLGREYLDQIKPWLRRQINGNMIDKRGSAALDRWMRGFRVNMSLAVMGLSYSTAAAQTLGLGQSAARIGPKWVGVGFKEMLKNPTGMRDYVFARSQEMTQRGGEVNREVTEFFNALKIERGKTGTAKRWYRNAQAAAFWHIAWMDRWAVSLPTWLGAYHKGLSEGMTDEEASAYGDKIVRQSQGSGREKDLSAWQSPNNETMRFWTMFYTPFNVALNMQWKTARMVKSGNWRGAAQMQIWLLLALALGDALQGGDWPKDEDGNTTPASVAKWFSRNVFFSLWSGVPVARDFANVTERWATGRYAQMQTPISALFDAVTRAVRENRQVAIEDEDFNSQTIRANSTAAGYLFGLPGNQIGKTTGFLWDVHAGEASPDGVRDWWSGITSGRLPLEDGQ